jgi:short-subunit dehydrogenase
MINQVRLSHATNNLGVVVNVASVAGLLGIPYGSYYSATKFSVVGYSDSLRRELQSVGVRVACLEPGFAKTNILHMPKFSKTSEFAKYVESKTH